ncbi:hypothetical protein [Hymenobacter sp. UYP22]|uniref:hypothetical protein n=1 Tax=Hymenobacter sp. UYP22 TaxID=3156348 RepID=UPI003396C471
MFLNYLFFFPAKTRLPRQHHCWLLLLVGSLLVTSSCSSKEVQVALPTSFLYQGDFHPSFLPDARFVIQTKQGTGQLKWTRYKWIDGYPGGDQQVVGIDSVALTQQDVRFFFSVLDSVPLLAMVNNKNRYRYTDGIMVENDVWQNGQHHRFRFWTPKKPSSEHKLVEAVLGMARRKFPLLPEKVYLESLEQYFDFGLPCEITSTRPWEVRIHGVIYGDEKWLSDLQAFLQQLPTDEPILIDMTNSRGMAWACFPLFRTFLTHNEQVIWVTSPEALTDLHQMGVPAKRIAKTVAQGQQLVQAL